MTLKLNTTNAPVHFMQLPVQRYYDELKFNKYSENFAELRMEIIQAFLVYTPPILNELKVLLAQGKVRATGKVINKLKSSAAIFCVDSLFREIVELETGVIQINTPEYSNRVSKLIASVQILMLELSNSSLITR